jgi:hypothetical protein
MSPPISFRPSTLPVNEAARTTPPYIRQACLRQFQRPDVFKSEDAITFCFRMPGWVGGRRGMWWAVRRPQSPAASDAANFSLSPALIRP